MLKVDFYIAHSDECRYLAPVCGGARHVSWLGSWIKDQGSSRIISHGLACRRRCSRSCGECGWNDLDIGRRFVSEPTQIASVARGVRKDEGESHVLSHVTKNIFQTWTDCFKDALKLGKISLVEFFVGLVSTMMLGYAMGEL